MKPLYQLVNDLKFFEEYEPETPESEQRVQYILSGIHMDIEEKIVNIAKYILSLKAEIESIKQEKQRLQDRQSAVTNRMEWLKGYLFDEMKLALTTKVKRPEVTVSIQASPASVEVIDINKIPDTYTEIEVKVKKKEILDYYKTTNIIVSGVNIITGKEHLVIR